MRDQGSKLYVQPTGQSYYEGPILGATEAEGTDKKGKTEKKPEIANTQHAVRLRDGAECPATTSIREKRLL